MKLLKFYTDTCGPCKVMTKNVETFLANHPEIEYKPINCSEGVPDEYAQDVRSVPTVIVTREDAPNIKIVGIRNVKEIEDLILHG